MSALTGQRLRTLAGDIVRSLLEDVGGRGEGRGAEAAGRDVGRVVRWAEILGILILWEAGVGGVILAREERADRVERGTTPGGLGSPLRVNTDHPFRHLSFP